MCQANRYENSAGFFIGFLEFLQTFFAKAREFIEHILWEILKVIRAFGFFESDTCFQISHMQIKLRLKCFKSLFCGEVVRSGMIETLHET